MCTAPLQLELDLLILKVAARWHIQSVGSNLKTGQGEKLRIYAQFPSIAQGYVMTKSGQ